MKRAIYLLVLLMLMSGCLAAHEQKGYWGKEAYSVTRIQDDVFKVTIREDASPNTTNVSDLALSRCADATREYGFSYFVFIDKKSLVIQCFKEKPEDTTQIVYDAEQVSGKSTREAKE